MYLSSAREGSECNSPLFLSLSCCIILEEGARPGSRLIHRPRAVTAMARAKKIRGRSATGAPCLARSWWFVLLFPPLLHLTSDQESFRAREDSLYVPSLKLDV